MVLPDLEEFPARYFARDVTSTDSQQPFFSPSSQAKTNMDGSVSTINKHSEFYFEDLYLQVCGFTGLRSEQS